jgi:isopenicillin-N N-acyltransferase-like protein
VQTKVAKGESVMDTITRKLRVFDVAGDPYTMGRAHGERFADDIRAFAEQRLAFCADPSFTGKGLTRDHVMDITRACIPYHEAYYPAAMDELRGIADATGLTIEETIILNGFTDLLDTIQSFDKDVILPDTVARDDCTAFIASPHATADGQPYVGQTWDMNREATPYIFVLRAEPDDGPRYITMTVTGCIAMIGMNEAGISIGITNLCGADGRIGVTWTFVVRKALAQDNLKDAISCIMDAPLAGGHNYYLADSAGRCVNIEAMATQKHIETIDSGAYVHTNHCLVPQTQAVESLPDAYFEASAHARYARANTLLQKDGITVDDLMALTRDHGAEIGVCVHLGEGNLHHVESGAAAILSPATREMWAIWGNPCQGAYEQFVV